jgi:cytochrome c peroxidase
MGRAMVAAVAVAALAGCGGGGSSSAPAGIVPDPGEAKLTRLELIGKRIFNDTTLSNPAGQGCVTCHDPASAFEANPGSVAGVPFAADGATLGLRNTPTAMYASFTPKFSVVADGAHLVPTGGQFMDGRAASLEEQAAVPFLSTSEMNLASAAELSGRLVNTAYAPLMLQEFGADLFGDPARVLDSAARAIAAFERTADFAPFSSKYDNSLAGAVILSDLEKEGLKLFGDTQKGNCSQCHIFRVPARVPSELLFTDFSYHNLGVPRNARVPSNRDAAFFDLGLCGPKRTRLADDALCGAFKVPTLRNVARKQSFMHNGFFTSLRDVVAFYATRDTTPARWYATASPFDDVPVAFGANVDRTLVPFHPADGSPARLDDHEIDAIVAFLRTLDDGFGPSRIPGSP